MHLEGDLEVLANLQRKQELLELGDPRHEMFRTALAGTGGALCGTYFAGQLVALWLSKLGNAFDVMLTGSTSSAAGIFFPEGQVVHARSVYWRECTLDRFLSLKRLVLWIEGVSERPAMDIDYLCDDVFFGMNDRGICLNTDALRAWRTEFFVTATAVDGSAAFLNVKKVSDPIAAVKASIAIPCVSRGSVEVDGEYYFDGDGAAPFPAADAIRRHQPTDILVLANRPRPKEDCLGNVIPDEPSPSAYLRDVPEGVKSAFATKHVRFAEDLQWLRSQKECRYLIIWTDGLVQPFDRNAEKLEAASRRAEAHLSGLLEKCREPVFA